MSFNTVNKRPLLSLISARSVVYFWIDAIEFFQKKQRIAAAKLMRRLKEAKCYLIFVSRLSPSKLRQKMKKLYRDGISPSHNQYMTNCTDPLWTMSCIQRDFKMRHESNIVILSEVVLEISRMNLKAAGDVLLLKLRSVFDFSAT